MWVKIAEVSYILFKFFLKFKALRRDKHLVEDKVEAKETLDETLKQEHDVASEFVDIDSVRERAERINEVKNN